MEITHREGEPGLNSWLQHHVRMLRGILYGMTVHELDVEARKGKGASRARGISLT
jgi:hypothetical protein